MFSVFKKDHPRSKTVYAVTGGKYLGELLVFMEEKDNLYSFLTLPEMAVREVPIDKFKFGLTEKIIDIVQKIPSNVYSVCKAQYIKNKSLISNTSA